MCAWIAVDTLLDADREEKVVGCFKPAEFRDEVRNLHFIGRF